MDEGLWVGRDEAEGIPVPARKDLDPPPSWRLEAVAETERPRSLRVGPDGRRAVFIQDRDTSDVWILDLGSGAPPQRLTTGRAPMPFWEDTDPRLSPDGTRVAYVQDGHVRLVAAAGGPPRVLLAAGSPQWVDDDTLIVSVERDDRSSRLAVTSATDPWPRRLAAPGELGDEWDAAVSPDRGEVAYVFTPRADLKGSRLQIADLATGAVRPVTGTPGLADKGPAWSPDGATLAYLSERSGHWAIHLVGRDGGGERQLTTDAADYGELRWHADGERILATRNEENLVGLATVDADTGAVTQLAPGGVWGAPQWTASGDIVATYEDHATPPELRLGSGATLHAPAPLAVKAAPHVPFELVDFPSRDGLTVPAFLYRPRGEGPFPAVVEPHGGPTAATMDEWDGRMQYFLDKGYAWLAPNFRGSTGYGRDHERANHGVWGVADVWDCLAAADFLRTLDWVDGDRLAIVGGSYGSYMALLSVTDDPEHRYRCAVAKYGDCDILTSWAQGDREGVQDLERMMGHPSSAREEYRAGSPVHRLHQVDAPLLIAHGERDERVHPRQSEELVAALRRLGKTFEYITYPTEAHGFLRSGPFLHFHRRLERFLDWYLL